MKLIFVLQIINALFCAGIAYFYMTKPKTDFYATSGIAPPVKLSALSAPNYSSESLLPPDPPDSDGIKAIPE